MELKPAKGLQRRVVGLHRRRPRAPRPRPRRRSRSPSSPTTCPACPPAQRVYVEDPATPAPGADAFRWFFYASSPPWTNTRHSLTNVRGAQKEFLVKLRNVYSFFTIYANIDGFSPRRGQPSARPTPRRPRSRRAPGYRPAQERSLLDRWMLSELALPRAR